MERGLIRTSAAATMLSRARRLNYFSDHSTGFPIDPVYGNFRDNFGPDWEVSEVIIDGDNRQKKIMIIQLTAETAIFRSTVHRFAKPGSDATRPDAPCGRGAELNEERSESRREDGRYEKIGKHGVGIRYGGATSARKKKKNQKETAEDTDISVITILMRMPPVTV